MNKLSKLGKRGLLTLLSSLAFLAPINGEPHTITSENLYASKISQNAQRKVELDALLTREISKLKVLNFNVFESKSESIVEKTNSDIANYETKTQIELPKIINNAPIEIKSIPTTQIAPTTIPTTVAKTTPSYNSYKVNSGDNLSRIARKYNVDMRKIAELNNISSSNGYIIHPNQVLLIPVNNMLAQKKLDIEKVLADVKKTSQTTSEKSKEKLEQKIASAVKPKPEVYTELNQTRKDENLDCYNTKINLNKKTYLGEISRKTKLSKTQIKEQLGNVKITALNPGSYTLCISKDEKTGYIPLHHEHNWKLALNKSGDEIWQDRRSLSVDGLGNFLGIKPGSKCIPNLEGKMANIVDNYSLIEEKAKKYNLSAEVLAGIITVETGGNSKCISTTGALGTMGLTKKIYTSSDGNKWFDGNDRDSINPFVDSEAVDRGADLLANLLKKYHGNYHYALTAYNQGEDKVDLAIASARENGVKNSYQVVSNYMETTEGKLYSQRVLGSIKKIRKELNNHTQIAFNN